VSIPPQERAHGCAQTRTPLRRAATLCVSMSGCMDPGEAFGGTEASPWPGRLCARLTGAAVARAAWSGSRGALYAYL